MRELLILRIISGSARGTKLLSLEGLDTRPTLDRVKEALFSSITPYINDKTVVLDLFAGSGALGLESLSRGALQCDFVDKNSVCRKIIESNISKTHFSQKSSVYICDYQSYINRCNKKFDLVFLDPPYLMGKLSEILSLLKLHLNKGAIIVVEALRGTEFNYDGYELLRQKSYGKVSIFILCKEHL